MSLLDTTATGPGPRAPEPASGRTRRGRGAPTQAATVRVGLIGAGTLGRAGLSALLAARESRCALVDEGTGTSGAVAPRDVDIVVVDVERLGARAADRVHRLVLAGYDPVVTLGSHVAESQRSLLLRAGAREHVSADLAAADLVRALRRVAHTTFAGAAHQCPGRPLQQVASELAGCSDREAEILELVARGLSNQEIAERLYLSLNTVKTYIRSAYRKIGVVNRSAAVLWGVERGLGAGATRPESRAARPDQRS